MSCDFQLCVFIGKRPLLGPYTSLCLFCWSPPAHWSKPHCGDSVNWSPRRPLLAKICIIFCLTPTIFSLLHCKPQFVLLEAVMPQMPFLRYICRVSLVCRQASSSMLPAVVHWFILVAIVPVILPVHVA